MERSHGGAATRYVYDGAEVVRDLNPDGSVTEYLNGLRVDEKLRQSSPAGTFYFTTDHLGSTTALTDTQGYVVERMTYDAFGNAPASPRTRYTYTGRERDEFTGLYYYRARWYDAMIGRFISEDPIGFAGGDVNLYGYVGNNPMNFKDPSGLERYTTSQYKGDWFTYNPHLPKPKREDCECPKNDPDINLMSDLFRRRVDSMTEREERHPTGWLNNFLATFASPPRPNQPYLGCGQQALKVWYDLEYKDDDNLNDWDFTIPRVFAPLPHQFVEARPRDPQRPFVTLDPMYDDMRCKCKSSN